MIFDFNIHLNPANDSSKETTMSVSQLVQNYTEARSTLKNTITSGNFMIFNQDFPFIGENITPLISTVKEDFPEAIFTQLFDFRRENTDAALDYLVENKISAIKFHSYVQQIAQEDIAHAASVAKAASERGLFVCIDASYGTTKLYDYDNLRLLTKIAENVHSIPIVVLHSGGLRCIEAALIAMDKPNIYMETSFTLPFYENSRVWDDLSFAYKKMGSEKILYASDFPAFTTKDAEVCMERFFDKYSFSKEDREKIYNNNARKLIQFSSQSV